MILMKYQINQNKWTCEATIIISDAWYKYNSKQYLKKLHKKSLSRFEIKLNLKNLKLN